MALATRPGSAICAVTMRDPDGRRPLMAASDYTIRITLRVALLEITGPDREG